MDKSYNVSVNQINSFEIAENDLQNFDAILVEQQKFHVLKDHKPFIVKIISADFLSRKYTLQINNNTYKVDISSELDTLINKIGIVRKKNIVINAIKAPMPGLVLEINVEVGQEVKTLDPLLILEAMKMENSFLSPRDGIIKTIAVSKGIAVDKGQLLIEFEN